MRPKKYYEELRKIFYELNEISKWEVDYFIDVYCLLVHVCDNWDVVDHKRRRKFNSSIRKLKKILE